MSQLKDQSSRLYFYFIVFLGFGVLGRAAYILLKGRITYEWLVFAALTALASSFTIKLPGGRCRISVTDAFIFTNITLFGPAVGSITAAVEGLLGSLRSNALSRRREYTLFNVGIMAASAYLAGIVLFRTLGRGPLYGAREIMLSEIMLPVLAMALVHYLANTSGVAIMVALQLRRNPFVIWRERFLWASLNYFVGASAAAMIAINASIFRAATLGFILPFLLVTYFAYKTYRDMNEADAHRRQLDKLYMHTVEALATAIDARESGTLGLARHVQVCARRLADALNIADDREVRGIEAAALLLDIGNLAVPEHILNNPGELSETEFRKVMVHPVVGFNILSSIDFPYSVAEYVRHHHERWDGLGYPDRLLGEQIPLGARILSVADSFVALICDRPYRKARGHKEAMNLIRAKSGAYYDPIVVAALDRIVEDLVSEMRSAFANEGKARPQEIPAEAVAGPEPSGQPKGRPVISIAETEGEVLDELTRSLGGTPNLQEVLAAIAGCAVRIAPSATCAVFLCVEKEQRLVVKYTKGVNAEVLKDYSIGIRKNLSGWVAEHREPVVNARALRDLAPIEERLTADVEYALVFPFISMNKCLGTISLYSSRGMKFTEDEARIISIVSQKAAPALQNALLLEKARQNAFVDPLTSLPDLRYMDQFFTSELQKARRNQWPLTIMLMGLDDFKTVNERFGRQVGDQMLTCIATLLRNSLRESDLVVRHGGDVFAAALVQTSHYAALRLSTRIQHRIEDFRLRIAPDHSAMVRVSIGSASYPEDGDTLEILLEKAGLEMRRDKEERKAESSRFAAFSAGSPQSCLR